MKESYRTIEQVASYLQCSESHVFELVDTGSFRRDQHCARPRCEREQGRLKDLTKLPIGLRKQPSSRAFHGDRPQPDYVNILVHSDTEPLQASL